MLLIARSDAESARLLSSTVDVNDHEFVLGTTKPGEPLADEIARAEAKAMTGSEVEDIETKWLEEHPLCTFHQGKQRRNFIRIALS